ncbi:hypothetical protein PAXRUDRAFT_30035 [Paxillus rubicundulus Ve08.2h10]|uniref:Protein kinase domain-containing protein n=1 Tax=Paxillus rubicundulus Ve08.2h10 TaxID=930991 RepID=A0A0D0EA91_9AGAM|nr:hypothetical protein PAXRUDRAFT_30035 [Paxillus rubicundulus Ve08.2h10]
MNQLPPMAAITGLYGLALVSHRLFLFLPIIPSLIERELESVGSSPSSDSSFDDDEVNARVIPHWSKYRDLITSQGYRLDTVRDPLKGNNYLSGYLRACAGWDDDALCKDPGLPENLFRATCCMTGMKLMIKAVNRLSREVQNVRYMSSPPLRQEPMNHYTSIVNMINIPADGRCFIVMEEWSSHLLPSIPSTLHEFLSAIHHSSGREGPRPHLERGQASDPYMIDEWALEPPQVAEFYVPEILHLTRPMLHHNPDQRPSAAAVLREFKRLVLSM